MVKKNWRDSGTSDKQTGSSRTGWSGRTDSKGMGGAGKAFVLLVTAGVLGALIAFLIPLLAPKKITRLLFCDSYPSTQGEMVLSSNAFATEICDRISEKTNINLKTTKANLRKFQEDVEVSASGPDQNVILVYVYTDIFLDNEGKPFMLSHDRHTGQSQDSTATQASTNTGLREFLEAVCRKDVGDEGPLNKSQRIVVLDYGRLDAIAFSSVRPEAIADAVKSVITTMRNSQVPNSENLWVMLAADDYQLGWTSPELNGSVFGFFFSEGLSGKANPPGDEDPIVTLAELNSYVRESVARWVENYRDAVQTPLLLCGGDNVKDAENIQLIHAKPSLADSVSGFKNQNTIHDDLWQQVFAVPQPHRRQMICTLLVRLEQIRYCKSQEYKQLTNQVKALLIDSKETFQFDRKKELSVFDLMSEEQLAVAVEAKAVDGLKDYLKPWSPTAPKKADPDPGKPESASAIPAGNQEDAEVPLVQKKVPREIMHFNPFQRLALGWHFIMQHQSADAEFGRQQLRETLNYVRRGDSANQDCDGLIEMQFLDLLSNELPWGKSDFNNEILFNTVRCFNASQSLLQGSLTSQGESAARSLLPDDAWQNWRHIENEFDKLENRRRGALDLAIAGQSRLSDQEFEALVNDYKQVRAELLAIVLARRNANDLLFIVPYLKSFALRDAVYRDHEKDESEGFCLPLDEIAKLEKHASDMILLLSGPAMTSDDKLRLKTLFGESRKISDPIRNKLKGIAIESTQSQSASKYVFETQNLLITPIPEWIDQTSTMATKTRSGILDRLNKLLKTQQSQYFQTDNADETKALIDIDKIAIQSRESATRNLAKFETVFSKLKPVESLATGLKKNERWNDVQTSVTSLPEIEQLCNREPENGAFVFADKTAIANEVLRLDKLDRQIRLSGPAIGLAMTASDIYQQQSRLNQFESRQRMLTRAIRDFWGSGDVTKTPEIPPPFLRQTQVLEHNLKTIAESMNELRLNGKDYRAYDSESLALIGRNLFQESQELWANFSRLHAAWQFNDQPTPGKLKIDESSTTNRLGMFLDQLESTLADPDDFPVNGDTRKQLIGQRVSLEKKSYFDAFEIPESLVNSKAWGTVHFRGHQFKNDLAISRKVTPSLPKRTFTFKPDYRSNRESLVTVENDLDNEVDLIFLLDCSKSITGEMKSIQNTTREIMLELAADKRFHIGLAAFGHRGDFDIQRMKNGSFALDTDNKIPVKGLHPFDDWEMLEKPPAAISDEQSVNTLWDFKLSKLTARGYTPLYYSISKTLPFFSDSSRKNILIVVTDGVNAQLPPQYPNDPRFTPKDPKTGRDKRQTTKSDLETRYARKYDGKVSVLVLQTKRVANDMPAKFKTVQLGANTPLEMKKEIFDAVGRYQFSVTPIGTQPKPNDRRRMGETIRLDVAQKSTFQVNTHGVPSGSSTPQQITLNGGEDFKYFFTKNGLRVDLSGSSGAAADFLNPRIEKSIQIGGSSYQVGRMNSNQLDHIRIGFANKRDLSQYPDRVWARVQDDKGREFDMTRPSQEFAKVPTYVFQLPAGMDAKSINMTLFVKPEGATAGPLNDQVKSMIEIKGEGTGQFNGLTYLVQQKSESRFTVTIRATEPISQAFHLDCPSSVPIGDDRKRVIRTVHFEDVNRLKEVFEFEIPTGKPVTFNLFVQPKDKFEAAINGAPPAQDSKPSVDPIFGDEVVAIRFEGFQLRK